MHTMLNVIPQLMPLWILGATNLIAAFLLLYGLQRMSSPVTAPSGIFWAGIGMLVVVVASFLFAFGVTAAAQPHLTMNIVLALVALLVGGGAAWWSGKKVAMTAMPQMVALYNGMGGGAAAAIAAVELLGNKPHGMVQLIITLLGALIGSISLSGSLVAWAKLQGVFNQPLRFHGQQVVNGLVLLLTCFVGASMVYYTQSAASPLIAMPVLIYVFFALALLSGILMTLPIGGADMPVVISIYNAFTGLAVGLEGLILQNPALMIAGMVVGAAGLLLTLLMAKAMNRSISNVLFTNFGEIKAKKRGAMKGSLKDVLLAEAGVPYDLIFQLEDINEEFETADVALVIGANDVVNPAARSDKDSPIFGMPILNADKAKKVYVLKRGEGKGYAGIVNALFYADNCNMVYGDAQALLVKMIEAVRGLGTA